MSLKFESLALSLLWVAEKLTPQLSNFAVERALWLCSFIDDREDILVLVNSGDRRVVSKYRRVAKSGFFF